MTRSSGASSASASAWYHDESTVLSELRRIGQSRAQPPVIPGYDDLHELHRGGQGIIYAAVQRSTRRRVAIKVLLDGTLASDAARHRFQREIDLVAGLRHPHIVRIYDSGVSQPPDARVYFVMEFIEGVPLHEHAAMLRSQNQRQLLQLFAHICSAVSFAHQHGVIHRDLKPSNIRIDADGEPHILDFGLAKIARPDETADVLTQVSIVGQFLGSLPWASPEQAQGDPAGVDVRSDVYSLGVIVYQMLTGRFPYDVEGGLRDVLDHIISAAPARPSTVDRTIDDEVETIVLKCLAKEPERRYQSAAELAQDVDRYLAGEPIQAKRDSAWYTMRKRLHRYRLLTVAAVLLALSLSAGITATLWQANVAAQQRDSAQRRFDDVRELARHVLFGLHDQIADLPGSRQARETLVTTALTYLEKLARDAGDDHELLTELAAGYQRVGDVQGRPNEPNLGDTAGALASYAKASAIVERLAQDPHRASQIVALRIELAEAIGEVQAARGQIEDAESQLRAAVALAEDDRAAHPGDVEVELRCAIAYTKLGDMLGHPGFANAGRPADAVAAYDAAEVILAPLTERLPDDRRVRRYVALVNERQGAMLEVHGRPAEALQRYQQSLALRKELVSEQPENGTALRDLAIAYEKVGIAHRTMGNLDQAADAYAESSSVLDMLLEIDPANVTARRTSALHHERIGDLRLDMGDVEGCAESRKVSFDMFMDIARRDPGNEQAQLMAAISRINLADVLGHPAFPNLGRPDEAVTHYETARAVIAALHQTDPDHLRKKRFVALLDERLGRMMIETNQISEAREYFQQSMALRVELAREHPEHADVQRDLGVAHEKLGEVFEMENDYAGAIKQYEIALSVYRALAQQHPETPQYKGDIEVAQQHIDRCTAAAAAIGAPSSGTP